MFAVRSFLFALIAICFGTAAVRAADRTAPPPWFVSELRFGVLYHEDSRLKRLFFNSGEAREDGVVDFNLEAHFQRPQWHFSNPVLHFLLTPRPRVGASINVGNGTSQASAGFAWDFYVFERTFVEFTFDGAIHNGYTGPGVRGPDDLRSLGCSPLFRQSLWLGYDVTDHWRVMFGIEHLDNFGLCHENAGLSNLGFRVGYRF